MCVHACMDLHVHCVLGVQGATWCTSALVQPLILLRPATELVGAVGRQRARPRLVVVVVAVLMAGLAAARRGREAWEKAPIYKAPFVCAHTRGG